MLSGDFPFHTGMPAARRKLSARSTFRVPTDCDKLTAKGAGPAENFGLQVSDLASQCQHFAQKFGIGDISVAQPVRPFRQPLRQEIVVHSTRFLMSVPEADGGTGSQDGRDDYRIARLQIPVRGRESAEVCRSPRAENFS